MVHSVGNFAHALVRGDTFFANRTSLTVPPGITNGNSCDFNCRKLCLNTPELAWKKYNYIFVVAFKATLSAIQFQMLKKKKKNFKSSILHCMYGYPSPKVQVSLNGQLGRKNWLMRISPDTQHCTGLEDRGKFLSLSLIASLIISWLLNCGRDDLI